MKTVEKSAAWKVLGTLAVVLAAAIAAGVVPRMHQREARARVQQEAAGPRRVRVAPVRPGPPKAEITLPGTAAPLRSSRLYGKSTGFLRRNLVEVGDRVKAGQLLAEIDAPETAEEIRLAEARLAEAEANVTIVESAARRQAALAKEGISSQQHSDDARAQANSALAAVAARRAELQRLQVLRGYQQILAPFDGVIARRGADPGALVGPAAGGGTALFEIADTDRLRVSVDVPDAYAHDLRAGLDALVFSPRAPAQRVTGKVTRVSGVLDEGSRTMRAEIEVRGEGAVIPGAFVYVRFDVPRTKPFPLAPASALVVRKEGTLLAKVVEGRIVMAPVVLGRDFGKDIELLDGASAGEEVVMNPPDELETGQPVEVVPPQGS